MSGQTPAPRYPVPYTISEPGSFRSMAERLYPLILELSYTAFDLGLFARDCGYHGLPFRWDEERRFLIRCELDALFFHLYLPAGPDGHWKPARITDGAVRDETDHDVDALQTHFPTPREAVDYIMETFPIVKRKDEKAHGKYRTTLQILQIYDEMADAIRTRSQYLTHLDPAPGPPADEQGNFLPLPEWLPGQPKPPNWPIHVHRPKGCTV